MGQGASQSSHSGWRILKVHARGPCGSGDLTAFMDYIIAADGVPMASESSLVTIIKKHHEARSQLKLTIYNMLSGLQRDLYVQPSDSWGGEGLLGLIIRFDTLKQAEEHAIHILDVFPNSPAHLAGLIAHEDYLLGTCDTVLKGYSDLEALLTAHAADADANGTGTGTAATTTAGAVAPKRPLTLCVFNAISRSTREVALEPRLGWGGAGLLGCNIGHGWLHRLPLHSAATIAAALSAAEQMSEPITVEVDESGTISFLISVLVADTDQMITLPVVIFPTDVSLFEYQAYNALAAASSSVDNATQLDAGNASASGIDAGSFPPAYGYAPTQPQPQQQQSLVDVNLSEPTLSAPPHAPAAHAPFAFPHPRTASLSQPYPFVPLGQQQHMQQHQAPALPAAHATQQRPYWTPPQPQQQQQQQPPQTKFVGNEGLFLP